MITRTPSDQSHLDTRDYDSFLQALVDAQRVSEDLLAHVNGELLIAASEVEFLARRINVLLRCCIIECHEAG